MIAISPLTVRVNWDIQIFSLNTSDGAAYEARTRYLHLGKVALYQMS